MVRAVVMFGAAVMLSASAAQAADGVQAAFVVLGDGGQAVARVITSEASCPDITVDGETRPMAIRAPAGTAPVSYHKAHLNPGVTRV